MLTYFILMRGGSCSVTPAELSNLEPLRGELVWSTGDSLQTHQFISV